MKSFTVYTISLVTKEVQEITYWQYEDLSIEKLSNRGC